VEAVVSKGALTVPGGQAVFLQKFCFDYAPEGETAGFMHISINTSEPASGTMQLAVFDDEAKSFPDESAFWGLDCDGERLKQTARWVRPFNASKLPHMVRSPLSEKLRPRWWYVAVIDCSGEDHVISYELHLENVKQGWQSELSMDRCRVTTLMWIFLAYALLLMAQLRAVTLKNSAARTKHPLRLMLLATIGAAMWGSMLLSVDGLWFTRTGEDLIWLYFTGKCSKAFSGFILMSMLLLLSKGHCISCALRRQDVVDAGKLIVPLAAGCLWLEVWGEVSQERRYTTGFVYCTFWGFLLVLADLGLLALYLLNLRKSHRAEIEDPKRTFYCTWGPIFSVAFAVRPVMVLVAPMINPWVRSAAVQTVTNVARAILLALFVVGIWPERTTACLSLDNKDELATTFGMHSDLLCTLETELSGDADASAGPLAGKFASLAKAENMS
jgi:hypothetical protein